MYKKILVFVLGFAVFAGFATQAVAFTPTLSLSSNSSNNVTVSVVGDPNSTVMFYYSTGYGTQSAYLGTTSNSGYFSTTLAGTSYNLTAGNIVYVLVNGQQSASMNWPGVTYTSSMSLSQYTLSLGAGQTSQVTASNLYGTLYIGSNSNSGVATASVSGNTVSVYGANAGTTNFEVCQSGQASGCRTLYVTVTGYYNNNQNTVSGISVTNANLSVGNSITFSSANNNGLYVSNNSNPSVVSTGSSVMPLGCVSGMTYSTVTGQYCYYPTTINNSSVTLTALTTGTSTLTLCQNNYSTNGCTTLVINVNNSSVVYNPGTVLGSSTCNFYRTLSIGKSGSDVTCLQTLLINKGYAVSATGYFDSATRTAIILFQQDNGLYADGIAGSRTRTALYY